MPLEGNAGSVLTADGIAMIDGLQDVLGAGVTSFDGGNIILGGDGSDTITGRGGDDMIDGDKWLNVRISVRANSDGYRAGDRAAHDSMTELAAAVLLRGDQSGPAARRARNQAPRTAPGTWTPRCTATSAPTTRSRLPPHGRLVVLARHRRRDRRHRHS